MDGGVRKCRRSDAELHLRYSSLYMRAQCPSQPFACDGSGRVRHRGVISAYYCHQTAERFAQCDSQIRLQILIIVTSAKS